MPDTPSYLADPSPDNRPPRHTSVDEDAPGISSVGLIVITIVVIAIIYGLCMLLVSSVMGGSKEHNLAVQRRILYNTDPGALLTACRQLAVDGSGQIDPASTTVPGVIHQIDPKKITIADGKVVLECGTNYRQFGVIADISSDQPTTQPISPMALRELTPGLWYYAEEGTIPPP
ncbi:MAG: hypothetical protein JO353_12630 [Phycisphaerae bacterium]|nr:hypothetical protein [Phycisphaerae bacterium]